MRVKNILATDKEKKKKGDEKKKAGKISEEENNPGIRGNTNAHRKASQGYHHEDNQQLIRAGAILRLATLEAAASRLWRRSDSRLSARRHASSSSCAPLSSRGHLPMFSAAVTQS